MAKTKTKKLSKKGAEAQFRALTKFSELRDYLAGTLKEMSGWYLDAYSELEENAEDILQLVRELREIEEQYPKQTKTLKEKSELPMASY